MTSHDVVGVVRRAARSKRVGHAGTLDPFATGLLVIGVGNCTRLLPYIVAEPKVYDACIQFGFETDTHDATGEQTTTAPIPDLVTANGIRALTRAMQALTGTIQQIPPSYSAKHVNGERAYAIARRGEPVVLDAVTITVSDWTLLASQESSVRVRITCGGGTYIRALARDLGRGLHSAAHCAELRRVSSGPAHVHDAVALTTLTPGAIAHGDVLLQSPLAALGDMAHEALDDQGVRDLAQGRSINATTAGLSVAFVPTAETSISLGRPIDSVLGVGVRLGETRWQPRVVLLAEPL